MRTRWLLAVAATAAVLMGACANSDADDQPGEKEAPTIALFLPESKTTRYEAFDRPLFEAKVKALCADCKLLYSNADQDAAKQQQQVEAALTQGADVLVLDAVDASAVAPLVNQAKQKDIPVIAYDRLIRNSPNVDYYATFDNFKVGVQQATSLLVGLGLKKEDGTDGTATGPFNVELFAGSPDDNNATFFFNGAMATLKPFIDKGTLVVKSGQTDFKTVAILRWDPATAQKRMEDILTKTYSGGPRVQGVLSPYDGLSIGILSALKSNGYGTAGQPYPVVTGQDAEVASVKSIIAGEQFATIYKDTRELAKVTVSMADAVLKGGTPQVNNTKDYDNGIKVVPSYLLDPIIVYKTNYQKVLIDSGYYTADKLK